MGSDKSLHWLLISFDQWRGDWLDKPVLQLNTLKQLRRRSLVAERCVTSSPQCVPSRASWLTGLWPSALGVTRNGHYTLPGTSPSFVRTLKQKGWKTALIGKTHWHPHTAGADLRDQLQLLQQLGFDEANEIGGPRALAEVKCALTDAWEDYEPGLQAKYREDLAERYNNGEPWRVRSSILPNHLYPDIWVAEQACTWLRQRGQSNQPWLLWVSFPGPHEPWDTPLPWAGRHDELDLPQATPRPNWITRQPLHSECRRRQIQWDNGPGKEAIKALRSDYANHLTLLDQQVEKLMNCLAEPERTALTIVSDHGELLGDAGFLYKSCFLEGAIKSLAIHHRPDKWKRGRLWRKPLGLSCFISAAAKDVSGECELEHNSFPHFTLSEFGDELLVSDRYRKLVMTRSGEPLWATNFLKDPAEQINLIDESVGIPRLWNKLYKRGCEHLNIIN